MPPSQTFPPMRRGHPLPTAYPSAPRAKCWPIFRPHRRDRWR